MQNSTNIIRKINVLLDLNKEENPSRVDYNSREALFSRKHCLMTQT